MSHSYQYPQPRQLPKSSQKKTRNYSKSHSISLDSSISSSSYNSSQILLPDDPNHSSSPTTSLITSCSPNSPPFTYNSKPHPQHSNQWCAFRSVLSRPWLRLKLYCSTATLMASQAELSIDHIPYSSSAAIKKLIGQQKKQELERELLMLRKMLDHEEKVHDILQQVHRGRDASALRIPSHVLPPKMKELLDELATVEGEITRLESQISSLQAELNHEKKVTKEAKSKEAGQRHDIPNSPYRHSTHVTNPSTKGYNEKLSFETKALHFISKAIKGDYNLSDFSIHDRLRSMSSFSNQTENHPREEADQYQEINPKKSGILKTPSPFRDTRHQTPKKERTVEFKLDPPSKAQPSPIQSEEDSIHKLSPNKLSESIMKCLIFIYVRLLRTSRVMEIEKSGPISRSSNFSLSFRAEPSLNSKATAMLQKESRQQDPYGIFDMEESIPRDIGSYKNLVKFTSSCLEPKCISNSSYVPLLQKLRAYMNDLKKVDLRFLTSQQKLAFWINIYNACIMHGFLQYGVPPSPEKLLSLMNKATLDVGGNTMNAQAIEDFILRKPAASSIKKEAYQKGESEDNEARIRALYGLKSTEPNIIFSLCCGTRSSPAVKIYTADGIVAELERSKLEYLQASVVMKNTKKIALPELLLRNMHDFATDLDSLAEWVCQQLPTSGSLRKSMVDCFRGISSRKISTIIEKIPYEFEFQYLLSM